MNFCSEEIVAVRDECNELVSILVASVRTAQRKVKIVKLAAAYSPTTTELMPVGKEAYRGYYRAWDLARIHTMVGLARGK
jgi:hypothetical protein